ncbi:MAG: GNAT family N-acetyltransferase [Actinobacteria bacterium]|nr:MAG: GNAT family N-acetyltransferase [Actinomycetota bacterium]
MPLASPRSGRELRVRRDGAGGSPCGGGRSRSHPPKERHAVRDRRPRRSPPERRCGGPGPRASRPVRGAGDDCSRGRPRAGDPSAGCPPRRGGGRRAFDGDIEVSAGMYSPALLDVSHVVTATKGGKIVGVATGVPTGELVGVFGVAVASAARRQGIGAALTRAAARAEEGSEIAWLSARAEAAKVYERLGFRAVGRTEVWVG